MEKEKKLKIFFVIITLIAMYCAFRIGRQVEFCNQISNITGIDISCLLGKYN